MDNNDVQNMQTTGMVSESTVSKWGKILDHEDHAEIKGSWRRAVTAQLLENTYKETVGTQDAINKMLNEAAPSNNTSSAANWNPVLIDLVRRAAPNLIAYDVCGVQPMSGPSGLVFAMAARYQGGSTSNPEALFNRALTKFAGSANEAYNAAYPSSTGNDVSGVTQGVAPFGEGTPTAGGSTTNTSFLSLFPGSDVTSGEALGDSDDNPFPEMGLTIEQTSVTARTRALKAEYTIELAQDLNAIHGVDAEAELVNILSTELNTEINREIIELIYKSAKVGASFTTTPGVIDLSTDVDGRWSQERFLGLHYAIERDANVIAKETRRGKGNFIICSSDVASALALNGKMNSANALAGNINTVDDTQSTFVGTLHNGMRVYIDPYSRLNSNFYCVGYRGVSPFDAGLFYCPYVPLQMVRAVGENTFQPKVAFKTRYGVVYNPFVKTAAGASIGDPYAVAADAAFGVNQYYRIVRVDDLQAISS